MNLTPASSHDFAKVEFSLKKPYPGWMAWQPCSFAIEMMRWPFRYWSVEPRLIAKGDDKACWECLSGSVYKVVVLMPYWDAVLLTRSAISPRLAISILLNGSVDSDPDAVDVDVLFHLRLRLGNIVALPPRKALSRAAEDIIVQC